MEMNTFYVLFAAAIIAAAKSPEMKASFNNNLPNQNKDVLVNPINPVNPDSKPIIQDNIKMKITQATFIYLPSSKFPNPPKILPSSFPPPPV